MILAGFDTQMSSALSSTRPGFWRRVVSPVAREYAEEVVVMDRRLIGLRREREALGAQRDELMARYRELADFVAQHESEIAAAHPGTPKDRGRGPQAGSLHGPLHRPDLQRVGAGQWVAERRRDELHTVGLYMRWGRAALNNRRIYNIAPPASGSLESILGHVGEPYLFVDLTPTGSAPEGAWVHEPITAKTWGRSIVNMTLYEQYDAILFIDEVHPPSYR